VVRKNPTVLLLTGVLVGTENVIKGFKSILSPDDESSDVSSWSELEKVESGDVNDFNTWDVSQGLDEWDVLSAIDDQWSSSGSVPSISLFSSTGSNSGGVDDLLNVVPGTDELQESNSFSSSFNLFNSVFNNQWEFWDLINSVSSGLD